MSHVLPARSNSTKLIPAKYLLAAAVSLVLLPHTRLAAQTQPGLALHRTIPAPVESAALLLPEAPEPQNSKPSAPSASATAPCTPPAPATAPSSASASTQPAPATSTPPPPCPPAGLDAKATRDEAERELQTEEKQRLLGIMPQFQVVMGGAVVPLTPGEKFRLALHSAIDPFYIGYAFVVSGGYGELVDSHPGFRWGPEGYFKRVGAGYADNVNGAIIGNALLPIVLHQDPRYFRKGTGSIKSRFLYAALSTVICHGDNGKNQPNVSNILGNFISGAISNAYYPASERGVALTLENGLYVTLYGAVGGQILEFGPDIARHLHKKKPVPIFPQAPDAVPASIPAGAGTSVPPAAAPTPQ